MYCEYIVRIVLPNLQCFKFRCNEGYTSVTFYVKNYIQKKWIEVNHCDGIVELTIVSEDDFPITY